MRRFVVVAVIGLSAAACSSGGGSTHGLPTTTISPVPQSRARLSCTPSPGGHCLVPGIPVSTWTNGDIRAFIVNWDAARDSLDPISKTVSAGCALAATELKYPKVADYAAAYAANGNRYPADLIAAIDRTGC
jgi:hypothetical protein